MTPRSRLQREPDALNHGVHNDRVVMQCAGIPATNIFAPLRMACGLVRTAGSLLHNPEMSRLV